MNHAQWTIAAKSMAINVTSKTNQTLTVDDDVWTTSSLSLPSSTVDFLLLSAARAAAAAGSGLIMDQDASGGDPIIGDTHLIPYPGTLREVSWWEAVVKVTCYAILFIVSLLGNVFVVWTVARNRTMRSPTTYYLVNLAVCDLMVTLLCVWIHLVVDLTEGWVFGAFFCKFSSFAQVLSLVSSILTITLIACDRLFGVVCPVRAHLAERERGRSWPVFLTGIWLVAAAIAAPLLVYRRQLTRRWSDHVEVWCADDWPYVNTVSGTMATASFSLPNLSEHTSAVPDTSSSSSSAAEDAIVIFDGDDDFGVERQTIPAVDHLLPTEYYEGEVTANQLWLSYRTLYYTLVTLVLYFVPVVVMSLAYAAIVGKLWSHRRPGEGRDFDMSAQLELSVKKKVIKMLSVLLSAFVVCWLPSQVTILYSEYRSSQHLPFPTWFHGLQYFATFLAYANSAINPIIYTCFNENFRKGFRSVIRCCHRRSAAAKRRRRFDLASVDSTYAVHHLNHYHRPVYAATHRHERDYQLQRSCHQVRVKPSASANWFGRRHHRSSEDLRSGTDFSTTARSRTGPDQKRRQDSSVPKDTCSDALDYGNNRIYFTADLSTI